MRRTQDISNRLNEVLLDGRWIANTNYRDQIESITWQEASYKIGSLNTIGVLVFHINYYLEGLLHCFKTGELLISDQYSFDAPKFQSKDDWDALKAIFIQNSTLFVSKIKDMEDSKLDDIFIDAKYGTYGRNIEAVIEHSYYHLGQISLIKKMIADQSS